MGKRKERRIAALAAGRRVKLDLFAEPSGEMVGSSLNDEAGVVHEQSHLAGDPNSPSSSGHRLENPLLLLGQYSDEDVDEKESEKTTEANKDIGESGKDEVVENLADEKDGDLDPQRGENGVVLDDDKDNINAASDALIDRYNSDENDVSESGKIDTFERSSGTVAQSIAFIDSGASGAHNLEETEWRSVLDDESGRYYYWNVNTGETAWELPDFLVQRNDLNVSTFSDNIGTASVNSNQEHSVEPGINVTEHLGPVAKLQTNGVNIEDGSHNKEMVGNEVHKLEGKEHESLQVPAQDAVVMKHSSVNEMVGLQPKSEGNSEFKEPLDGVGRVHMEINYETKDEHETSTEDNELSIIDPAELVRFCEKLLQRLKALDGCDSDHQGPSRRLKHVLEVKLRLSDCMALAPCGLTLLPFWLHTETQLQQIEAQLSEDEASFSKAECPTLQISANEHDDVSLQKQEVETETDGRRNGTPVNTVDKSSPPDATEDSVHLETLHYSPHHNDAFESKDNLPSGSISGLAYESGLEGNLGILNVKTTESTIVSSSLPLIEKGGLEEVPESLVPRTEANVGRIMTLEVGSVEDVDMDVDMEVDDGITTNPLTVESESLKEYCASSMDPDHPSSPALEPSNFTYSAPLPTDEEWIPPPPPDNELIPPPPPDEPAPPLPTSPAHETVAPSPPYPVQYTSYTAPTFEYYPAITETATANYYVHPDSSQILEAQVPYYESVANAYPAPALVLSNPVEPVSYYGIANGIVQTAPIISSFETSAYYSEPSQLSQVGYVENSCATSVIPEVASSSSVNSDVAGHSSGERETKSVKVASSLESIQATVAISPSDTTVVASAAVAKNPSKVVRGKKRTIAVAPTLRANKKVSTLVDKWKAAKEELQEEGEEDELENAYELFEKKRQKEIEKWRMKQIASGEAKDNANFQPLGGDWRARVKRKRMAAASDAGQTQAMEPEATLTEKQLQPDLEELTKSLPSDWQAYWDESSGQVYYWNMATSETTWTRPT
ncbi:hypothetical protein AMTRI_Chr10g232550 [Amborella trichopoda]